MDSTEGQVSDGGDLTGPPPVGIAALHSSGRLSGFLVSGRWPDSTVEWQSFLVLTVRIASLPGMLPLSTVFSVREERPDNAQPGAVGLVMAEGTVMGDGALGAGHFGAHQPAGIFVLHPPSETIPTLPEHPDVASGCVLLPGLPHLGLDHRAAWAEVDVAGTVTRMVSRAGVNPADDADTAVLAMLLAA